MLNIRQNIQHPIYIFHVFTHTYIVGANILKTDSRIPFECDKKPNIAKIVYGKNIMFVNSELHYQ